MVKPESGRFDILLELRVKSMTEFTQHKMLAHNSYPVQISFFMLKEEIRRDLYNNLCLSLSGSELHAGH